jgi:hypothetical protein
MIGMIGYVIVAASAVGLIISTALGGHLFAWEVYTWMSVVIVLCVLGIMRERS